jgi:ferredoxin
VTARTVKPTVQRPDTILDVLQTPLIGRLLRSRRGRLVMQIPLLLVALLVIYDGFTGDQIASRNIAGALPWVHYRGLVVLALLLAGNLFCMGCPFTLPRTLARRWSKAGRRWPQALRNKWVAIAGLLFFFWLYEWLDLWASPLLTAWVVIVYFVASFVLEMVFTESAFCKYVCPLGTFNFAYSTASPLQIQVRHKETCVSCVGKECVNGSYSPQPIILIDEIKEGVPVRQHTHDKNGVLGCGTLLFAPQIRSNMDCTMCLDCVRACPHDNIALAVRHPLRELRDLSAWPKRWDLAFLIVALAFLGLVNAFGMIPPVYELLRNVARITGITSEPILLGGLFLLTGVAMPALLGIGTAFLSLKFSGTKKPEALRLTFTSFAPAFVPLGFGIWLAHYLFHLLTGGATIIPIVQKFLNDHYITIFGAPDWSLAAGAPLSLVALIQIVALIGGFIVSALTAQRIAFRLYRDRGAGYAAWLPFMILFLLMTLSAFYIFSQPMEMRGAFLS